jgi:NAD(P)H-dependent FMN reductase
VLKNALDHLYAEWNNKAVGFVSYGGVGGARAAEHLRLICGALQMADVPPAGRTVDADRVRELHHLQAGRLQRRRPRTLLDQVVAWSTALAPLRAASRAVA